MLRIIVKRILFGMGFVLALPLILPSVLEAFLLGERHERILGWCKEILSLVPTIVGEYIRLAYYWSICKGISLDVIFMFGSMVAHRNTVIRRGTVIGVYSILGYADIGENVMMGARVSLISGKYQHGRPQERAGGGTLTEQYDIIAIGNNSWIGQDSILMANVGENCTIGAGSVVYKDVPSNCTFMGNPARKVSLEQQLPPIKEK
jgi:acetyltransferase-like isoleucine patch superfamily enzyme